MSIKIACPGCHTMLRRSERKRGQQTRCRVCNNVLTVPADAPSAVRPVGENGQPVERRRKKRRHKSESRVNPMLVAGVAGLVVMVAVAVAIGIWLSNRQPAQAGEKAPEGKNPPASQLPGDNGGEKNLPGNLDRLQQDRELRQLMISFVEFCQQYNAPERSKENFIDYIKGQGQIRSRIVNGYYLMNLTARMDGSGEIIAYVRDAEASGHLCIRSSNEIGYVSASKLKQELGLP
jgi:hypothetical protein